ncbi:MAG: hypothetical protein ABUL62_28215 [Myxococcales bacterium]
MSTLTSTSEGSSQPVWTIDRSAAGAAKGPRLQRIRVALFLLEAVAERDNVQAYAAVEAHGDAFLATATADQSNAYSEEDKNYALDGSFTFAADEVLNSVVLFLDQWLNWKFSKALRFGFYATVSVGKEKNAGRAKQLDLTLPAKPILELLHARDYSDPNLLLCVKALVLCEYEAQYSKGTSAGHIATLKSWDDEFWKDFLALISWMFGEEDEAAAQTRLVDAVKKCRFYNESHEGKEQIIASALIDLLDEKQLCRDFSERFVHASHVELLFLKAAAGELTGVDPTWREWQNVPSPTDTRNVGEKFTAACPTLSSGALTRYQRRTAAGLAELEQHSQDKNVIAMRFQIYDVCEEAVAALAGQASALTEAQLDAEIKKLTALALQRVQQRANEYGYSYKTEAFVQGVVLELFDSCFLAFDRGAS